MPESYAHNVDASSTPMATAVSAPFSSLPSQRDAIGFDHSPSHLNESVSFHPTSTNAYHDAGPPTKKQRVILPEVDTRDPWLSISECVEAYVSPAVDQTLAHWSSNGLRQESVQDISAKVVDRFTNDACFKAEYVLSRGHLSLQYQRLLAEQITAEVNRLSEQGLSSDPPSEEYRRSITPAASGPELHTPTPLTTPPALTPVRDHPLPSIESPNATNVAFTSTTPKSTRQASQFSETGNQVSPLKYRWQARALAWTFPDAHKSRLSSTGSQQPRGKSKRRTCLSLQSRPYLKASERKRILRGSEELFLLRPPLALGGETSTYHVDFTREESEIVRQRIWEYMHMEGAKRPGSPRHLDFFWNSWRDLAPAFAKQICLRDGLERRDENAVLSFIEDAAQGQTNAVAASFSLELDEFDKNSEVVRRSRLPSLLLTREVEGRRGFGRMRQLVNFTNEFRKLREDDLELHAEWTGCAGDIATITWVSNDGYICGTTAHSDAHNQQYNKPGNLLLGSPSLGSLRAYPQHRIVRPIVEKGENASEAMRESQDPWLYCSVVSSDYDTVRNRAFTSSFDKTVKVWRVDQHGADMKLLGTWPHEGNVNFVVASKNGSGLVATAADVPSEAIRVYYVTEGDISSSPYRTFSGSRTWNEDDKDTKEPQTWAYYPATMQWGVAPEVQHLLLVGYSPRSFSVHDDDIPEGKRHSGEICLWDCITGERRKVLTATTQNVFEVAWHPTQPSFIVATSPSGLHVDEHVRTQIRIFRPTDSPDEIGAFTEVQCLDCTASDINELTIMPCSMSYCYVTAAATDGNVYVWDTARGDEPIQVLCHDAPVEESSGDFYERERDDTGVKFTAWGTSQDRFYTGGSDGMVKVWNVRNLNNPLVRDLLEAPGPISFGAFSPDRSKLAIGDATGRVFLLSVDETDQQPADRVQVDSSRMGHLALDPKRWRRRPRGFQPHPTPPAPEGMEPTSGCREARKFLEAGQIRIHRNPCIGAVQGENYATLGMYHAELHKDGDPSQPLVGYVDQEQRENATMYSQRLRTLRVPPPPSADVVERHRWNAALDLDLRSLPVATQQELRQSGVGLDDFTDDAAWDFEYEED